jgi:hypothetical protein
MAFLKGLLANWKTTLAGVALLTGAASSVATGGEVNEATLTAIVAGVGLLFGKDGNVTGGSKPQTKEAEQRAEK